MEEGRRNERHEKDVAEARLTETYHGSAYIFPSFKLTKGFPKDVYERNGNENCICIIRVTPRRERASSFARQTRMD